MPVQQRSTKFRTVSMACVIQLVQSGEIIHKIKGRALTTFFGIISSQEQINLKHDIKVPLFHMDTAIIVVCGVEVKVPSDPTLLGIEYLCSSFLLNKLAVLAPGTGFFAKIAQAGQRDKNA